MGASTSTFGSRTVEDLAPDHPYRSPRELLVDQIRAMRMRLEAVKQQAPRANRKLLEPLLGSGPASPHADALLPIAWPQELLALEVDIAKRVAISDPIFQVPIGRIRLNFRLTATEERVLWLLIAHELCEICRGLVRAISTEGLADPSTHVLRRAVYEFGSPESWTELAANAPLRRLALIERADNDGSASLERQTWKASERVLALAHGIVALDPKLGHLAPKVESTSTPDLEIAGTALDLVRRACTATDAIVIVSGPVGYGRRSCLLDALSSRHRILTVDGRQLSKERAAAESELRALGRECILLGYTPLIRNLDALAGSTDVADRLDLVELELPGFVAATAARPIARTWGRHTENIELRPLPVEGRIALWKRYMPTLTIVEAEEYAGRYPIAPALIHAVGVQAMEHTDTTGRTNETQIKNAISSIVSNRLSGLATRITAIQAWEEVVLPDDQRAAISVLIARVKLRTVVNNKWGFARNPEAKGLGIAALFSGPPGTGKTMMAGIIARDLGVDLYQVDISKIVSKWIGETEKNLAQIFDAADSGHAVILFDEADALFGKRTEVKSSNDRFANQETNFLLTRIESFAGIVILTTNHETAIDPAFKRRLSQHIQFPMPEVEERKKLWRALLPNDAPTEGTLPFDKLAQNFEMSGGNIRNALGTAAYLAAIDDHPINATHLLDAARQEYEAMGKIPTRM